MGAYKVLYSIIIISIILNINIVIPVWYELPVPESHTWHRCCWFPALCRQAWDVRRMLPENLGSTQRHYYCQFFLGLHQNNMDDYRHHGINGSSSTLLLDAVMHKLTYKCILTSVYTYSMSSTRTHTHTHTHTHAWTHSHAQYTHTRTHTHTHTQTHDHSHTNTHTHTHHILTHTQTHTHTHTHTHIHIHTLTRVRM